MLSDLLIFPSSNRVRRTLSMSPVSPFACGGEITYFACRRGPASSHTCFPTGTLPGVGRWSGPCYAKRVLELSRARGGRHARHRGGYLWASTWASFRMCWKEAGTWEGGNTADHGKRSVGVLRTGPKPPGSAGMCLRPWASQSQRPDTPRLLWSPVLMPNPPLASPMSQGS